LYEVHTLDSLTHLYFGHINIQKSKKREKYSKVEFSSANLSFKYCSNRKCEVEGCFFFKCSVY
jgi:hypothetical protein